MNGHSKKAIESRMMFIESCAHVFILILSTVEHSHILLSLEFNSDLLIDLDPHIFNLFEAYTYLIQTNEQT
jgi:hypothetical protein